MANVWVRVYSRHLGHGTDALNTGLRGRALLIRGITPRSLLEAGWSVNVLQVQVVRSVVGMRGSVGCIRAAGRRHCTER